MTPRPGRPRRAARDGTAARIARTVAAACLLLGAAQGRGAAQGVSDTVRATLGSNPEIGASRTDRLAVDQQLRQARAGYLPSLDARASAGPEYTKATGDRRRFGRDDDTLLGRADATLRLSQMLFDGFETASEVARQRARVDGAANRVGQTAELVALDAVEAHLEVLRNRDLIRINEDNVGQHDRYLARVTELERGGRTDTSSIRQTEARRSQAQANLATARGDLADALATYEQVVGARPADGQGGGGGIGLVLEVPPAAALPAGPEEAAAEASGSSPAVLAATADVAAAAADLRGARAAYYPRADAELAGTANQDVSGVEGSESTASAVLVLRYSLYRGGGDIAREREATQRLGGARSRLDQARREAERDARTSYNALETARARTVALRARAEAQLRTRDAYASQFDIGTRDLLDLLDAENELLVSRATLATAEYTERFAVYRVLAVIGRMLDALGVPRPPEAATAGRPLDRPPPAP